MSGGSLIGQMLDGKYRIESEIGKGGMGTVFLATHIGTERPVALKVIASEFMQRMEFVERFRREARAAGRLRHPNVVNVTDFGFAKTRTGEAAYLVMEYLDGCTLGEILEEEKQLPLTWTLDILEQVCSAVQEAHEQGIIHRDLKPDNIWLEPNQRGGYTVKVLDFGIAKLEEPMHDTNAPDKSDVSVAPHYQSRPTVADAVPNTIAEKRNSTIISESATLAQFPAAESEAGTLIQSNGEVDLEAGTAIFNVAPMRSFTDTENDGTKLIAEQIDTNRSGMHSTSTAELTRVGAVLGTPLYMSPEQCRGEKLTAQSDIYSLGVIAFQMLEGKTPFGGDYLEVMEAHKETLPPLVSRKIRKKIKRVINSALSKKIEDRPPTAQAFAAELRAESEGIRALFRRALMIYSEHLGKFLGLSFLLYTPIILLTALQLVIGLLALSDIISLSSKVTLNIVVTILTTFLGIFCAYLILGTTTWLVTQILAVPLRPVALRPALWAVHRKWKTFAGTGLLSSTLGIVGIIMCVIPGLVYSVLSALVGPVMMMENVRGFSAIKRSKMLVTRSLRTTTFTVFLMFVAPFLGSASIAFLANAVVKSVSTEAAKTSAIAQEITREKINEQNSNVIPTEGNENLKVKIDGDKVQILVDDEPKDMGGRVRFAVREALTQILLLPLQIFIGSFSSIVIALLYLKTRQVGGESMQDLLSQFEEADQPRTNWQRRVHERLAQSAKHTSKI